MSNMWGDSGTVVEKSFSNQKVASSIPCRSVLEQDTEPLIAPDVQCAISVNVKCKMCIHCKSPICKSLWIKASAKCKCLPAKQQTKSLRHKDRWCPSAVGM